jgi:hypothetical protein
VLLVLPVAALVGCGSASAPATDAGTASPVAGAGAPSASVRGVSVHAPWLEPDGAVAESCDGSRGLIATWSPEEGRYPGDWCGFTAPEVDHAPAVILTAPGMLLPEPPPGGQRDIRVDGAPAVLVEHPDPATGEVYLITVTVPGNRAQLLVRPDQTDVQRVIDATRVQQRPADPADATVEAVPVPGGATLLVGTLDEVDFSGGGYVPGVLAVAAGGCVGRADGGSASPLVWPRGTTPLPDGTGIDAPGLGAVRWGEELFLAAETRYLSVLAAPLDAVPASCLEGVDRLDFVDDDQDRR